MKKTIAILCALLLALSLCACSMAGNATQPSPQDETTAAPEATQSAAPQETPAEAEAKTYVVGICQLVPHAALDAATQGFQDALKEKLGDAVTFQLNNAAGDSATCAVICGQLVSDEVDLILANATAALQAAASATNQIPVLGTSITDYGTALGVADWSGVSGSNISGTCDLAPLDGQAEMLHELFPEAKTVGLLYCSGEPNSKFQDETITPLLEAYGYEVKAFTFADSNDVAAVTANACGECDVLYIPTDNTAAACTEAINNVALNADTPIVCGEEGICSGCGVATLSISYYELGWSTGEMAYEILVNGADVSTMPVRFAPTFTKEYNASICETLGITVPADYTAIPQA